jgi:hypothetical protein
MGFKYNHDGESPRKVSPFLPEGRRVQLTGTNYLSLAEAQVFGVIR